jgi:hypothetical protein
VLLQVTPVAVRAPSSTSHGTRVARVSIAEGSAARCRHGREALNDNEMIPTAKAVPKCQGGDAMRTLGWILVGLLILFAGWMFWHALFDIDVHLTVISEQLTRIANALEKNGR